MKSVMDLAQFDYDLPEGLIAQEPVEKRDESRLLVVNRERGGFEDLVFSQIENHLQAGDLLILNDTQVFPARLHGVKTPSGAAIEMLLLERLEDMTWIVIAYRASRLKAGTVVEFSDELKCRVLECLPEGKFKVEFECRGQWDEILEKLGEVPLPPYIEQQQNRDRDLDRERYQTVYAKYHERYNSAAAPTAGLHFTPELLDRLKEKGVKLGYLTLRVGLDTFLPMRVDRIDEHKMHTEAYYVPEETTEMIHQAKSNQKRVVAVGTTSVRVLESATDPTGGITAGAGESQLFIYPGYHFKMVDAMITNFHLPKTTLLLLVSAFMGMELRKAAYRHAVDNQYRFYSYGDAMFIE